ncbi:MAG: chemotaxis protein CheA [Gemmatimonadetes bacterium]|nr:chemotaxis protein CheA [Gemmatimonadota bacterium]
MDPAKYAELFLAESREHLTTLNQQLLAWEADPEATEPVGTLFRAVHTIKGMAATMGYTVVATTAHRVENLLDLLRERREAVSAETLELLFRAADVLEEAVEHAVEGEGPAIDPSEVLADLDQIAARLQQPKRRRSQPRISTPDLPAPMLGGREVRVRLRSDAPFKGARALLVLVRMESLGKVLAVQPAPAALEVEGFDGNLMFRLESEATDDVIVAEARAAGDVELVTVDAAAEVEARKESGGTGVKGRYLRVDLRRFDSLVNLVGELVTARSRLAELAAERADPELENVSLKITHLSSALQSEIIQVRMTPVWHVFDRFPRLVRDVARRLEKRVAFHVEGKEIELDRAILDEISDPLVHLLRNAIDHGIESLEEREAAGKRPEGRIVLSAARESSSVVLRVADDGGGIDRERALADAKELGLVEEDVEEANDDLLVRLLSHPGYTTAEEVSDLSGRGVGLDIVATQLQSLGGSLDIQTEKGKGTTFVLRLPPTVAILPALLTSVGEERFVLPLTHVEETVDLATTAATEMNGSEAIVLRDRVVPLVDLRTMIGADGNVPEHSPVIILRVGGRRCGLVVDHLMGQREIVIKAFDAPSGTLPIFSGATILGDGQPVLILDAARLV